MFINDLHPEKAPSPILITELEINTFTKDSH